VPPRQGNLDRQTVLDTAVEQVDTHGVETLTVTAVANELGVSQPALYRHVEGIDDLWRALGLAGREQLADALAEAAIGRSGAEAVHAVAHAWRAFGREHPGLYAATDRFAVAGDAELEDAVERVVEVLALSLRGFGLDDDALVHGARTLRSALHGFVSFELGDGHPNPHDPDETFERMIDLLCRGFAAMADGEA
jgi:AcrR family transcriptional regulator